jgi:dihydroneopterin aldolase
MMQHKYIGRIDLEEMQFYAYHGCFEEEQRVGNHFNVNISIEYDCTEATGSDNIIDAVNYVAVYEITRKQISINSHLLEHVTSRIIDAIYDEFPHLKKVTVKVSKMTPPMGGQMRCVSLTLSR